MLKKCEYCDSYYDDTLPECPNCGAINKNVRRTNNETPHTIEELQAFFAAKHIDENQVRFFIGKDVREPKCFGIYKNENGDFVVYKNKSDGTRAIRYEGTDEAYAVNELFMRLENELINQHSQQYGAPFSQYGGYYDQLHNNQQGGYNQNTNYTQNSNTYVPQGWHNVNEQNSHWNYRTGTNNYYNQGNWNGGAGMVCGMGYLGYAVLFTLIMAAILFAFTAMNSDEDDGSVKVLSVTIPENLDYNGILDDLFSKYTDTHKEISVKTMNMGSLFRLKYEVKMKDASMEKQFIDDIRTRNGNLEVSLLKKESDIQEL